MSAQKIYSPCSLFFGVPELPEVQTIVNDLNKVLPGLKIQDVWCDAVKNILKGPKTLVGFKKEIEGRKVLNVKRKGKNILINLSEDRTLLVHQKMTGHLLYGKWEKTGEGKYPWVAAQKGALRDDSQNRFLHLIIDLSNGKQLALSDIRKFAKVLVYETSKQEVLKDLSVIGPDPLEKGFTVSKFKEILGKKRGKIKDVLMKQEIISGIGNIYSNEILWDAGIHPFRFTQDLTEKELEKIYKSAQKILKQSLKLRGDSMVDFRDAFGEKGRYQKHHKAYDSEGKKCPKNDGGTIRRIKEKGRSAFYCDKHQK